MRRVSPPSRAERNGLQSPCQTNPSNVGATSKTNNAGESDRLVPESLQPCTKCTEKWTLSVSHWTLGVP